MIISTISASNCTPQTIVIGRRGTYDTMQIAFDLSYLVESYGNGVAVLAIKRSQDESAYPAVTSQADNILTWIVSDVDTYYVGAGECQLMWYVDGGLAKTIIYPMVVMRDILQTAEQPPDGYENWIEHLTELGAETQQNAQNAAQSASEAEQAKDDAVDAKEASEEAARKAAEASVHAPIIQNGFWYIWSDDQYVNTNVRAEGEKGDKGDTGEKGDTGNGIASITKTGTSGLVDTYTVTYTDGTSTTFTVTNGAKGDKGDTGATGNGIASIAKTGTSGNVDTYTITYTNGQTVTFTVTNGAVSSVAGKTGAVVLDSGDIEYDSTETYTSGTAGAALSDLTRQLSDVEENQIPELKNAISQKAPVIINTASGDIASFPDGADDMPIKSLVASIEPVQDLHGYEYPWPGGGGVNKWDEETELGTIDTETGEFGPSTEIIRTKNYIPVVAGNSYLFVTTDQMWVFFYDENKTLITEGLPSGAGSANNARNFRNGYDCVIPTGCAFIRWYFRKEYGTTYKHDTALNYPSTVTTYSPYSNECPISGWTGANGQNTANDQQWDEEWEVGAISVSDGSLINVDSYMRSKNYIPVAPGKTYYRAGVYISDGRAFFYGQDKSFISHTSIATAGAFDVPYNACFMKFHKNGASYSNDISINYPATDTTYHPYIGNQISVNWQTEAGTVYGGTIDVATGLLTVTWAMITINGSSPLQTNGTTANTSKFGLDVTGKAYGIANMLSNMFAYRGADTIGNMAGRVGNTFVEFSLPLDVAQTVAAGEAWFADNPTQLCYELATPQTYQLTPQEVKTLLGTNNVWADTGNVSVTYPADTKLYIDNKITTAIANSLNA